jgi:uncharacterized cupredoxin-like copper-binding protein
MFTRRTLWSCVFSIILANTFSIPAFADVTVKVSLWDKGGEMDMSKNMGMGMGMHSDMKMAMMGIKLNRKIAPEGNVTFDVENISKDTIHEMIVARVSSETIVLPYNENENRVNEDTAGDLGEVSELEPGKSGKLTIELRPGLYILYCNIPGHYMAGMWTMLKVQK